MTILRLDWMAGVTLSDYTQAQEQTIDKLEAGLHYIKQGIGVQHGDFILPIYTDGDDGNCAIMRDGKTIELLRQAQLGIKWKSNGPA